MNVNGLKSPCEDYYYGPPSLLKEISQELR